MSGFEDSSLEAHGLRYRMRRVWGAEPLWNVSDLDKDQRKDLDRLLVEARADLAIHRPGDEWFTDARAYTAILVFHGLRCDHPANIRQRWMGSTTTWECKGCGTIEVGPPPPRPRRRIAVLSDGTREGERYEVQPGQMSLSFAVPAEHSFLPLESELSLVPACQTIDYHPTGRVHEHAPEYEEWISTRAPTAPEKEG